MKTLGAFLCSLLILGSRVSFSCTSFQLSDQKTSVVSKSYDWSHANGFLVTNKRNVAKVALVSQLGMIPASWVSRYGSLTFNQHGREFPLGGMNEKGLVAEMLWLEECQYPRLGMRPSMNEFQWLQYQLDNFHSVEEVVMNANRISIHPIFAKVHYLVCDPLWCASFEYLDRKLVVHTGETMSLALLTNHNYAFSTAHLRQFIGFGGTLPIPAGEQSLDRFVRAADWIIHYDGKKELEDHAFLTLKTVAQETNNWTKWNIVYHPSQFKISFRSRQSPQIKTVMGSRFSFSCRNKVKTFNINQPLSGDITHKFVNYSPGENRKMIELGTEGFPIPQYMKKVASLYPQTTHCLAPLND